MKVSILILCLNFFFSPQMKNSVFMNIMMNKVLNICMSVFMSRKKSYSPFLHKNRLEILLSKNILGTICFQLGEGAFANSFQKNQ